MGGWFFYGGGGRGREGYGLGEEAQNCGVFSKGVG